jgi:hypothetical protein
MRASLVRTHREATSTARRMMTLRKRGAMAFDEQKARLDDLKERVSRDKIIGVEVELLGLLASATNPYIRKNLRGRGRRLRSTGGRKTRRSADAGR